MSPEERDEKVRVSRRAIGKRLAELRAEAKLSAAKVGSALGLSGTQIQKWEAGDGEPNEADMESLARLLGITLPRLRYGQAATVLASDAFLEGRATLAREMKSFIDARVAAAANAPAWPNMGEPDDSLEPITTISTAEAAEMERQARAIVVGDQPAKRAKRKGK